MPNFARFSLAALVAFAAAPVAAQLAYTEAGNTYDSRILTRRAILGYDFGQHGPLGDGA